MDEDNKRHVHISVLLALLGRSELAKKKTSGSDAAAKRSAAAKKAAATRKANAAAATAAAEKAKRSAAAKKAAATRRANTAKRALEDKISNPEIKAPSLKDIIENARRIRGD